MSEPEHFFGNGLEHYARRLREGAYTIEAATRACLGRITATNDKLQSFVHADEGAALQTARALDQLLAAGTDLGPLMGVPVAIKDLIVVSGMPTRLGSRVDLADILPAEGSFVRRLRTLGCIVLGKTRTTEFAMGGFNLTHPTAWNPRSPDEHLTPGGSSAGSAVAVASGQCPLAIGGDTGGSVREPAALCGVVGTKTSPTRWELDGMFSFSPTFDSIGYFTNTVVDAAYVYGALAASDLPTIRTDELVLGRPSLEDFVDLAPDVAAAYENALAVLEQAGVRIEPATLPDPEDVDDISRIVAIELIGRLGRQRLDAARGQIDPVPMARLEAAMDAAEFINLQQRRQHLVADTAAGMRRAGLHGWLLPTVPHTATPVADLKTVEDVALWNARTFRITRLANLFDQVAISIPSPTEPAGLPVGLQLSSPSRSEARLLAMAVAIERSLRGQAGATADLANRVGASGARA